MQSNSHQTSTAKSKPKLKLVPDAGAKPAKPRLAGRAPTADLGPGKYMAQGAAAWIKGKNVIVQHWLLDGKHDGIGLRQWMPYLDGDIVSARYMKQCEIALGRPLTKDDPYDDPAQIFVDKRFLVSVGYRKSEKPDGRGRKSDDLALYKKDSKDQLRVHEIISLQEI